MSRCRLPPLQGRPLLLVALCLAATAWKVEPAEPTEPRIVVDPVNHLAVTLTENWTGTPPTRGLKNAVFVLQRHSADPPAFQEGHFPDDWLKIELTAKAMPALAKGALESRTSSKDPARFFFGDASQVEARLEVTEPSADGLQGPPALVLSFPLEDPRGLNPLRVRARLVPADSLVLDEALPVLASLRALDPDSLTGHRLELASPLDGAALDSLSRTVQRLAPKSPPIAVDLGSRPLAKQNLVVSRPITGSTLLETVEYTVRWDGAGATQAAITLHQNGQQVACLFPAPPAACAPAPLDQHSFRWDVASQLAGENYVVQVQDATAGTGTSGAFSISRSCGPRADGSEAPGSPIALQMPFAPGTRWTVGGGGSFYGSGFHCNGFNDYYATDWNQAGVEDDTGARVLAVARGLVIRVVSPDDEGNCAGAFGCLVSVKHAMPSDSDNATTFQTTYAHLQSTLVAEGDFVWQGQDLGTVGNTGQSSGAHLHLQFREAHGQHWSSRCSDVEGQLCPNGEVKSQPQGYRPSPMGTADGEQELVNSTTYTSSNGIAVTEPVGDSIQWRTGETETIAWLSYQAPLVRVELCHAEHGCLYIVALPPQFIDRWNWQVPTSLVPDSDYFVRASDYFRPGVKHESRPSRSRQAKCRGQT